MRNILVSIEADLPSSIALRYACRLATRTEAKVQVIHVKEPDEAGPAVGAGWARLTWQKELLAQAHQEITQILRDELTHCATLAEPIVAVGNRPEHVLAELGRNPYDLLVEGMPAPPTTAALHHALHAHALQKAPCPVLLALTMAPLQRVLVCIDAGSLAHLECFGRLFSGSPLTADLAYMNFGGQGRESIGLGQEQSLEEARRILTTLGVEVDASHVHQGRPETMAGLADDYGLVVAPLSHESHHHDQPWLALLGNTATSMLLC